ncbi:hypothetical protein [Bacillus nitratireducens]|uniref:hypothetical protein n=1 Tax=Bacillus nitratireducens TaxID=2026193 RepID=UPI00089C804F|nr:hypothetical protein [Bacillus nitratireducens]SEB05300.1 hypothetical protein SAMN04488146_106215 [Bacillus nitratireducens]
MGDYSKKSDEELERLYNEGDNRTRDAENMLYNRGYILDPETDTWDLEWNQEDNHSNEAGEQGTFFLVLAILIAGLIAFFIGGFIVVAYAVEYATYIYIGFVLSFALMYLTKGNSKLINFLFYLGCLALATRLFTNVIELFENVDYVTFITRDTDGLGVIIKYGVIYVIYAAIIPLLVMKKITAIVRQINSKSENENSTLNR